MDEINNNEKIIPAENDEGLESTEAQQTDDAQETSETKQSAQTPEKNRRIQTPIMIAACILVAAVLAFFCFRLFFGNSVVGSWIVESDASADEAGEDGNSVIYYTFNSDNTAALTIGSMQVRGEWWYADDNGATSDQATERISVSISYFFNGVFNYELSGNSFAGRTLTLSSDDGASYDFVNRSVPVPELKPDDDFKTDDKLVGEWNNAANNITYVFNADGTCHINEMDTLLVDGVYSVKDGNINIKYLAQEEADTAMAYTLKGSTLTISGLEYQKVDK